MVRKQICDFFNICHLWLCSKDCHWRAPYSTVTRFGIKAPSAASGKKRRSCTK